MHSRHLTLLAALSHWPLILPSRAGQTGADWSALACLAGAAGAGAAAEAAAETAAGATAGTATGTA